jgi:two-component sensor histidine kinase
MKTHFFLIFLLFCLIQKAAGQPKSPATFQDLQRQIAVLPDTVRFERLVDFYQNKVNETQFTEAAIAIGELTRIAQQSQNRTLLGRAYMAMGYLEKGQNKPTQAILNFQKAEAIFGATFDYNRQIRALQRISGIYIGLRELVMARLYCERALKIAHQQKLKIEIANLYTDLATIEDIRKNHDNALFYNDQAIRIYQSLGEDYLFSLLNRAIILKNAGRYPQSVETYQAGLKIAQERHEDVAIGMVYINLPNTLLLQNRLDEAEQYIRLALDWSKKQPESQLYLQNIYETLTAIYEKRGRYQQALAHHKQWVMYRDSIFNAEKSRQLIETETRFQIREKQQQIQHLDEDNLRQKQQLGWLAGGTSLLALLLGLTFWQYRTIRRVNRTLAETNHTLSEANQHINKQSVQLKELMRELHHRVKNNLAIVSSLLYLQSNRLEDESAVRAVREGQQRVEAMSLIHQQLYQTDNVTRVSMKAYIGDLIRGLMQSFSHKDNFDLRVDIAAVEVDVELAVPLGLILNELTTNAFKHAYHNVAEPQLSIRLWEMGNLYLEIKDNGPGIDVGQWQKPGRSFGKRLINSLIKQAGGDLIINTDHGTCFLLILPGTDAIEKNRPVLETDAVAA